MTKMADWFVETSELPRSSQNYPGVVILGFFTFCQIHQAMFQLCLTSPNCPVPPQAAMEAFYAN